MLEKNLCVSSTKKPRVVFKTNEKIETFFEFVKELPTTLFKENSFTAFKYIS